MKTVPGSCIIIDGHADQIGSQHYNLKLSRKRAQTVARALTDSGIVKHKIIKLRGFDKKNLKCRSLDESCRKWNRRAVLRIVPCPAQDSQGYDRDSNRKTACGESDDEN